MKATHLAALALVVSLTAAGATLAHGGAAPAAAQASLAAPRGAGVTTTTLAASAPARGKGKGHVVQTGRGGLGRGFGPGEGMMRGRHGGRGLTVTAVNGNTISASAWAGQAVTVTVSATTVYTEAGASATLADVAAGDHIAVAGTRDSAGGITATSVTIILPRVMGVVTAINGSTLTVSDFAGTPHTVAVGSATRYERAGQSATLADIVVGSAIGAEGKTDTAGTLSALRVSIRVPRVGGRVATVTGSSFTLSRGFGGKATTVTTSPSTLFLGPDGSKLTIAAVKVGSLAMAEGTLSSDGTTLSALRVVVLPVPTGGPGWGGDEGGFGRHGRGMPGGAFGPGALGGVAPAPASGGSI